LYRYLSNPPPLAQFHFSPLTLRYMAQENLAGRTIAQYRLIDRIGEGGTAIVYRAEDGDGKQCAVKILKEKLRNDQNSVQRFLREAEYGERVSHEGVVGTYEYGETEDLYFLALEWANGVPLGDFITKAGRVPLETVVNIINQLGGALEAAHTEGIIHRDLKPENIIYDPETGIAKLLDFGIARDEQSDPSQRLTRTGFFVGTLQYVAPEALSGELVGPLADIYSLATITYFMLSGQHPFDGRSPRELFQQLLSQEPRPLSQVDKSVRFSAAVEKAVMKGLERDPAKRPSHVAEFAEDLARASTAAPAPTEKSGFMGGLKGLFGKKNL
jgi:serine/threonine protein kinase